MMKLFTTICLLASCATMFAQLKGVGYYRVQNAGTNYYMYVTDNTGKINLASTDAEMGALQLYEGLDKAITNPATVIYFNFVEQESARDYLCNFEAQGVDVEKLIGYKVHVYDNKNGSYKVYASNSGLTKYLDDENSKSIVETYLGYYHQVGTAKDSEILRSWNVLPISAETDNYVAIKPTMTIGGKHYAPYYASFPFTMSEGMKAYVVTKIDADKKVAVYSELPQGSVVPGATPVLVECPSTTDMTKNKIMLQDPKKSYTKPAANLLKGVYFSNDIRRNIEYAKDCRKLYDANTMRVFGVTADGKMGFINSTENLHRDDVDRANKNKADDGKRYLNANQAYLSIPAGTPDELTLMTQEEYDKLTAVIPSDANGDGKVNDQDLMLIVNHLLGVTSANFNKNGADYNKDGKVNDQDLMKVVNVLLGN